jgi:hypothetical protein
MHGSGRLAVGALVAIALVALAPAADADTNEGSVAGLTYMSDPGPVAPASSGTAANVACPAGKHVVGGATTVGGTSGFTVQFWLNGTVPFDGADADHDPDDGWKGRGFNRFGSNKRLVVFGICSGGTVRYAGNHRTVSAGTGGLARAACPAGTHVAGGGGTLSGPAGQAYLSWSVPYDSGDPGTNPDDGWEVRAYNQGGAPKTLSVNATCVEALPHYIGQGSSDSSEIVSAPCPATTHVMGGGGAIGGPAGDSWLTAIEPFGTSPGPPDNGIAVGVHRMNPSPPAYVAIAVCKA